MDKKQKYVLPQIQFQAWRRCHFTKKQLQDGKVKWNNLSAFYGQLLGIDGEAIEFEWNIFPGFTSMQILQEIQDDLQKRNSKPEKFTDRIIFMSMINDSAWRRKGNDEICMSNSENVKEYAKKLSQGHRTFLCHGDEKKGLEDAITNMNENGILLLHRWCSDSKKQVTQSLHVPVL